MNPLRLIAILAVGVCLMVASAYFPAHAAEPVQIINAGDQSTSSYSTWAQTSHQSYQQFRTLDVFAPNWRGEYLAQQVTYTIAVDDRTAPSSHADGEEVTVSFASFGH